LLYLLFIFFSIDVIKNKAHDDFLSRNIAFVL
jgi:hypothetical protein